MLNNKNNNVLNVLCFSLQTEPLLESGDTIIMRTARNEKYKCILPKAQDSPVVRKHFKVWLTQQAIFSLYFVLSLLHPTFITI